MMGLFSMVLHSGMDMHSQAMVFRVTMMLDYSLILALITNHRTLIFETSKVF
jgi:hypothetical protein